MLTFLATTILLCWGAMILAMLTGQFTLMTMAIGGIVLCWLAIMATLQKI